MNDLVKPCVKNPKLKDNDRIFEMFKQIRQKEIVFFSK